MTKNLISWAADTPALAAKEREALERLLEHAKRDSGQSRRVADFLLAWWSPASCGKLDLTTLWGLDSEIADDCVTVFGLIARVHEYPDALGYGADFKGVVNAWRPELSED